ncbi:dTMP kinase [Halorhodospira halophila]|uniref:Thymidylate kinase n=1 Tax=Halorhodospira halophila (strain DSM 244 / SL1) TaxID=349124 RepID=KTHY_HALHL|nr:dTMP kinase [Halorhodospira halophila]A1WSY9.1 RecName: Full=Thymidylate kinase; AltName: Full=dTMP kinase [Halorhodospira halophila SL1]ABM60801.1 thymidylate kinase [Halorhodospira halophila SL1]MBK1728456.1 thymidylate kinase [Halorhodospira halophila]
MTERGCFITVEGLEGAGKTTCLQAIEQMLLEAGIDRPLFTREPGGTPFGEALRGALLDPQYRGLTAEAEALTVFAARAEHLAQVIRPTLDAGRWVISDRFTDATYAYQGGGRGLGDERIAVLERWVHGGFTPDRTLLLDVDPTVGRSRVAHRGDGEDRFEQERDPFFQAARAAYARRAAADPERFRCIDANRPEGEVAEQVRAGVADLLPVGGRP